MAIAGKPSESDARWPTWRRPMSANLGAAAASTTADLRHSDDEEIAATHGNPALEMIEEEIRSLVAAVAGGQAPIF
jgi:hypothetical protein